MDSRRSSWRANCAPWVLAGLAAAVVSPGAGAQVAPLPAALNPLIDKAQKQMDAGDFESAVGTLNNALADPDNTDEALGAIYRMLGVSHLYLDDERKARGAFERLLQVQPDYDLPGETPPKLREIYRRIKEDIRKGRVKPVRLAHERVAAAAAGKPLEIAAAIQDLPLGAKARLYYRRAGTEHYSAVDMPRPRRGDRFGAVIPAYDLAANTPMQYYVEVADAAQRRLAGAGDPMVPITLQVVAADAVGPTRPETDDAWYNKGAVWAIAGGVTVAAAAAIILVLATQPSQGSLSVTVRVQ